MKNTGEHIIVGIGINVNVKPENLNAVSIKDITGKNQIIESIASELINNFEKYYLMDNQTVIDEWKNKLNIIGKKIIIRTPDEYCGVVKKLTDEGYLVVDVDDGTEQIFCAGDLSII